MTCNKYNYSDITWESLDLKWQLNMFLQQLVRVDNNNKIATFHFTELPSQRASTQIAKFMGPTWGPPGSCRPQMGPHAGPKNLVIRVMQKVFPCRSSACNLHEICWTVRNHSMSRLFWVSFRGCFWEYFWVMWFRNSANAFWDLAAYKGEY